MPRIFAGTLSNKNDEIIGEAKFHFQPDDTLTRLIVYDGNEKEGKLHGELDPDSDEDDLMVYREKKVKHRGSCLPPLGSTSSAGKAERQKRSTGEPPISDEKMVMLTDSDFPRECSIKGIHEFIIVLLHSFCDKVSKF